jgi:hypothetical protein
MKTWMMTGMVVACAGLVCGGQPPTQTPPTPPAEKPTTQPAPAAPPPTPAPPTTPPAVPSLDDVLGLTKPGDKPKDTTITEPTAKKPELPGELERALKGEEEGNELQRAVALMDQSAKRLEGAKDTSLETQRMQEETVRLLDALVKKGNKKNNPQNKPQDQQQQQQQQQPNQSQQSQAEQAQKPAPDPSANPDRGGTTSAQLRPGIDAARAAWGNLPQRVRQLLMQGSGDQFSKEYQRLTEEYYKRLGEGGSGN